MMTAEQLSALTEWVLLVGRRVYPDKFPSIQPTLRTTPAAADGHCEPRKPQATDSIPIAPSSSPSV